MRMLLNVKLPPTIQRGGEKWHGRFKVESDSGGH
jgi:hypothetical protein